MKKKNIIDMMKCDGRTHALDGCTLEDAYNQGWRLADTKWVRGYISRKLAGRYDNQIHVYEAGGKRTGYIAYMSPSYRSTQYCHVTYLYHPDL